MLYHRAYSIILLPLSLIFFAMAAGRPSPPPRTISKSKYSRAHSLGENYRFDPRDGWQNLNASDLSSKYIHNPSGGSINLQHRNVAKKVTQHKPVKSLGKSRLVAGILPKLFEGLKALGIPIPVTITWYTGHDLENPSCWSDNSWAPTDSSFVCALTMTGWANRPACFKFIEICNGPDTCIFVRVVDTCAGCKPGSKHVDLTRGAFKELADPNVGVLTVSLRVASNEPDTWDRDLWGPKV